MTKLNQTLLIKQLISIAADLQPLYIILIGAPGSGKSTFIKALSEHLKLTIGSTDDQVDDYAFNHGITYSQAMQKINFKHLKRNMEAHVLDAVKRGLHVVIDQTNMNKKSRREKLEWASTRHVKVAVSFDVDVKVLLERIEKRSAATGKDIPKHVFFSMLKKYEAPTKDEGFDHVFELV